MGFNTTIVVLNDALSEIETDAQFGRRLAEAIRNVRPGRLNYVPAHGRHGIHGNAAVVVETHHSSVDVTVVVGGNLGRVVAELQQTMSRDDEAREANLRG